MAVVLIERDEVHRHLGYSTPNLPHEIAQPRQPHQLDSNGLGRCRKVWSTIRAIDLTTPALSLE